MKKGRRKEEGEKKEGKEGGKKEGKKEGGKEEGRRKDKANKQLSGEAAWLCSLTVTHPE